MFKRLVFVALVAAIGLTWVLTAPAGAILSDLGEPIAPHGFPSYYEDSNGLRLEPCLPEPAGYSTRPDMCVFDPLDTGSDLIVAGEIFWWLAETSMVMPGGGDAELTLGIEGTFGGTEEPIDGQQISFGRVRIRVDTPVPGTYVVTHPYGQIIFENVPAGRRGINYTADIGAANFLDPALGFRGALTSPIGPFLTWPEYDQNQALQVVGTDPDTGEPVVLEQYIGNPNVPSEVTGSPFGTNFFHVEGPGIDVQTEIFFVMGKAYDGTQDRTAHVFPDVPEPNLFAVGPVNRIDFFAIPSVGEVTGVDYIYPVGYPLWYQEDVGTIFVPEGGLQLTLCSPLDPMCIADPIDPTDPDMAALRTGGENFWFIAEANLDIDPDNRALVVLAVEATFGGDESITDGQQIAFGRERIRIDTPVSGTYRITHPYGQRIFENVPAGRRAVNFTSDIGIVDPFDPDGAFVGALYSDIGPMFLKWTTFDEDPEFTDGRLVKPNAADPLLNNYYIGDPAIEHEVIGSPFSTNYFLIERLEGTNWVWVAQTDLFSVAGKIFDPETFQFAVNPAAPVAVADGGTLNLALAPSVTIDVLANDIYQEPVTINLVAAPANGTAVVGADVTVTYTPFAAFAATGGVDTFVYNITDDTGLTSNNASVTVTVIPEESITVTRARLDLRKLRLDVRGTSNLPNTVLTIHAGTSVEGAILGQVATAGNGRWSLRGTTTSNLNNITVVSPNGTTATQTVQVR